MACLWIPVQKLYRSHRSQVHRGVTEIHFLTSLMLHVRLSFVSPWCYPVHQWRLSMVHEILPSRKELEQASPTHRAISRLKNWQQRWKMWNFHESLSTKLWPEVFYRNRALHVAKQLCGETETRLVTITQRLFIQETFPWLNASEQLRIFHRKYHALLNNLFGIILTHNFVPLYA